VLWLEQRPDQPPFHAQPAVAWQPEFVDRVLPQQRPGRTAEHEAGAYYCLDTSSIFAAVPMRLVPGEPRLVIDVCAAPGGKAIFSWRALRPRQIVCNEVIKKRTAQLIANLSRCHTHPVMVLSRDSAWFAQRLTDSADLVIVDAPCSGQSLVARGKRSPGGFHRATINMNSNRQKRILANSAKLLAPGGHLAYMTCTYSLQENERVITWLRRKFPQFAIKEVPTLAKYQSHLADFPCYRLWPQQGIGAGAFTAILQNQADGRRHSARLSGLRPIWQSPQEG
jgi:16S rRNA C967 or C1407 C5-methylase (RsmB/RsmF family)